MGNKVCLYCGAHLDPGEVCDCLLSLYALLSTDDRRKVDAYAGELLRKRKAPAGAANTDEGKAEQVDHAVSASIINENGGFVK